VTAGSTPFMLAHLSCFLADGLGRHELPRALQFRPKLPRSPVDKLLAEILIAEKANRPFNSFPLAAHPR
jgi:long-chain acyl-CoA synthetase